MNYCHYFSHNLCKSCTHLEWEDDKRYQMFESQLEMGLGLKPLPTVTSPKTHFRYKIKLTAGGDVLSPKLGLLAPNLQDIHELPECFIQNKDLASTLPFIKKMIQKCNLTPYSIPSKKGELKGIILSQGYRTEEKMIRFILRSRESVDRIRLATKEIQEVFHVVSANIQPTPHALLEGDVEILLSEQKYLTQYLNNITLLYAPKSFMQINPFMAEKLYATATEWALEHGHEFKILDLFCGVGGFGFQFAKQGFDVCGIEIEPTAIESALEAKKINQIKNISFYAGDASQIHGFFKDTHLWIMNPPRRGLGMDLIKHILHYQPPFFLYSSCQAETMMRDAKQLEGHYIPLKTQIFDMFPYTKHFESLTLFQRKIFR